MTQTNAGHVIVTALLRAARGAYTQAIRTRLSRAGFDDLPRNGAFVLGGIVNHGGTAGGLVRELRVTKQAASQLIDTLVLRGYLERHVDGTDRRRLNVVATDRGHAAADAIRAGVAAVDAELEKLIGADGVGALRDGLSALADIRDRLEDQVRAG